MRAILAKAGIKKYMDGLFVDDGRFLVSSLPHGMRWSTRGKEFIFNEDWKKEDEESADNSTVRTSRELCKAMNSIYSNIQWTVETEQDFPSHRIPSLDVELFMVDNGDGKRKKVNFSFFEKSVKNPLTIMMNSAMSMKTKIQILSNDLVRRMLNCSESIPQEERDQIVNNYIDRLDRSGYNEIQIKEIVESGLIAYTRKVEKIIKINRLKTHLLLNLSYPSCLYQPRPI